jgi:hypothetical protein
VEVLLTSILTNHSITETYILKATEGVIKGNGTCCCDRLWLQFVELVVVHVVDVAMYSKLQICIAVDGMK